MLKIIPNTFFAPFKEGQKFPNPLELLNGQSILRIFGRDRMQDHFIDGILTTSAKTKIRRIDQTVLM